MTYKISEVVAKTNVPKSTILYYIREGLLPEAEKIKPNVHRYSDEHVELIRYIRYMQESMGRSIDEIREALKYKNDSFSGSYTMLAPLMNTLSGDAGLPRYDRETFLEHFDLDADLLERLLAEEIVLPVNGGKFTKKDAAMVVLAEHFLELGMDYAILKAYVTHAKALAALEKKMQQNLCDIRSEDNFSRLWQVMFDTLFSAKEYLFNRQTYRQLVASLEEEIEGR